MCATFVAAFNDPSALTCLGNDLGYENVFAKQLDFHARPGDLLIAISSSGRSRNILAGVEAARARAVDVITFSGFEAGNALSRVGDFNFYVRSSEYPEAGRFQVSSSRLAEGEPGGRSRVARTVLRI